MWAQEAFIPGFSHLCVPISTVIDDFLDDLDAKMEMYMRCLRTDKEHGPFTARDPVLGRPLYKGRSV